MSSLLKRVMPKSARKKKAQEDAWKVENLSPTAASTESASATSTQERFITVEAVNSADEEVVVQEDPREASGVLLDETLDAPTGDIGKAHEAWHAAAAEADAVRTRPTSPDPTVVEDERAADAHHEEASARDAVPSDQNELGSDDSETEVADEAPLQVWKTYQRWRVTRVRIAQTQPEAESEAQTTPAPAPTP